MRKREGGEGMKVGRRRRRVEGGGKVEGEGI